MFRFPPLCLGRPQRRFVALVALPAILFAGALVMFGLWSLWITAERSDAAIQARQAQEVRLAIGSTLDELAQSQTGVAIWDLTFDQLRKPNPDLEWFDDNVGSWLAEVFNHEIDVIVDGRNRPVYAMENGVRTAPGSWAHLEKDLAPLILAVRGKSGSPANPHERLPAQRLHPKSTVRTSPVAVHATDLVRINGQAAAASVMRMVSQSRYPDTTPGTEPLLISIRYLNTGLMQDLEQERGILGARVTRRPVGRPSPEDSVPLYSSRGQRVGYFTWQHERSGNGILRSVIWQGGVALAALLALLAALTAGVGRLMFRDARLIRRLEDAQVELQASEGQALYLARHDSLTALPNRASFSKFVDEAIVAAEIEKPVGVMLIDIDRFKQVNDSFGHLAGDQLIQAVAGRLVRCAGGQNVVARLGGDEFAIAVTNRRDAHELGEVAEAFLRELRKPFEIMGSSVHIGGSIGIAICPSQGNDKVELLRKADIAMYKAKEEGRNHYRFFVPEMDESIASRRAIESDLRAALHSGDELFVAYQPKLDIMGAHILGLEALVRWRHPSRGHLPPNTFIPVAEECGLINAVGGWVLAEACRVARRWPSLSMAVNISPIQFRLPNIADAIRTIVLDAGVRPQQIELEVTEGILVEDNESVKSALQELRACGFRIALDDFGTGYSSLSYLRKFEVDRIKIDRSFVKRLGQDPEAIAIVQAVITLGHAMALSVTAEGVETQEQESLLKAAGCNELQGFLFSKALLESDLHAFLDERVPAHGCMELPPRAIHRIRYAT